MSKGNKNVFSTQAMKRLLRAQGAVSVSKSAAQKLAILLEEYGREVGRRAVKQALFRGRQRVKEEDVGEHEQRVE